MKADERSPFTFWCVMDDHTNKTEYTFALLSDIHIDCEGGGERVYFRMAADNFADALRYARDRGVDFILSAGDQITAADDVGPEWAEYRRLISESGYDKPVFAAFGNHESRPASTRGVPMHEMEQAFLKATADHRGFDAGRGLYYTFTAPAFGDLFIVMAMEGGMMVPFVDEFSTHQLDWLEGLLEKSRTENRRVFLVQHATVWGFGAGDDADHPAYDGSLKISDDFPNNRRFVELLRRYSEIIWLSGHSHVDLRDRFNFCDDGHSCRSVHIPALCGTTRLSGESGALRMDRSFHPDTAQGFIVRVCADRAIFTGMNFNTGEAYEDFTYTVELKA